LSEDDLDLEGEESDYYEEESFEEFDTEDAVAAAAAEGAGASGDNHDLASREDKGPEFQYSESQSRASFTKIVIFGTVIIALLAFTLYWFYGGSEEPVAKKEPPKKEVRKPAPKKVEPKPEPKQEEPKPVETEPEPVQATPGEITRLTEKTNNSYIVIGSFLDGDLADDYAQELAATGQSPTIIPPFDNYRFFRVAVASFNSFEEANGALAGFKADFGEDVWALRY